MKIWILNHYATDMYFDGMGRHQSFAKYMIEAGHNVVIFCANTVHNSDISIDTKNKRYISNIGQDQVPYVFIKTRNYKGNGKQRIKNMFDFYLGLRPVLQEFIDKTGAPDVILASSVHPLTLVAGLKFARKIKCPCICEIRDLWPLSIVEYSKLTDKNILIKFMYWLEHWIYIKANALIFSFDGGKKYILDKKWESTVNLDKVFYINTGIDLQKYRYNEQTSFFHDDELENKDIFKIVYTGSIREVNNIEMVVDAATKIRDRYQQVKFFIYGDGDKRELLKEKCEKENIDNVIFKGKVAKADIPSIISKADILLINVKKNKLWRYGVSWNKLFEYMAGGKPIISNSPTSIISDNNLGIAKFFDSTEEYVEAISHFVEMDKDEYETICKNCKNTVNEYDCKKLSKKIIDIAESLK